MRVIRNATYTGVKGYNKSRSNNFLEQKRINNLDMSTYDYADELTPYSVAVRYPGELFLEERPVKEALKMTKEIIDWGKKCASFPK